MHKPLESGVLADLQTDPADYAAKPKLSKKAKLNMLADIVEAHPRDYLYLFSNLEAYSPAQRIQLWHPLSIFSVAGQQEAFRNDGLGTETHGENVNQVNAGVGQTYFEMTHQELHRISCDCGGQIPKGEMAARLRQMANNA